MNETSFFPFLVADIGGTNARFALVSGIEAQSKRLIIEHKANFKCSDHHSFEAVTRKYLQSINDRVHRICIAIAGPIIGDLVRMTNLNWSFSIENLSHEFKFTDVKVINDFGALAYSTLFLQNSAIIKLYSGNENTITNSSSPRAIIGPGTGLGIASLIKTPNGWHPVCGEGGHVNFAPSNDLELELYHAMRYLFPNSKHIPIESLISGSGLANIYKSLCHIHGVAPHNLMPSDISLQAKEQTDEHCILSLKLFSQLLGSAAGNLALTVGATGGVYLGGGILPKIVDTLDKELLIEHFLNKGIQRSLLESIPIYLISSEMPALRGAAHWMYDTC